MRADRRFLIAVLWLLAPSVEAQDAPGGSAPGPTPVPLRKFVPPPPRRKADESPRVLTPEEVDRRKQSPFLQEPGTDGRYGTENPADLPPWSRASFFGVTVSGRFIVYVLDHSGSMIDENRLPRATAELRRSVGALQSPQRFEVFFYNETTTTMPGGPTAREPDPRTREQLRAWLGMIDPDGGTNPRSALLQALALRPDAVFLLSDGDFPKGTVEELAAANRRKIPIHCIDIAGGLAGDDLERIARQSGGRYVSRPGGRSDGAVSPR